jgi:CRISP-associated protein Cas1
MTASNVYDEAGKSPFDRIASVQELTSAWDRVLVGGGTPGGDGETVTDFAPVAATRIARLSRELQMGFYRPGPLRHVDIPKKSGGIRGLSIPCVVDRIAQRAAADVLADLLEPHFEDVSYGYRPGRSHLDAVAKVDALRRHGYEWIVDGDIRSFFDNVPHKMVLARLGAHVADNRLIQLVGQWLESFSDDGLGLAQGSPLSPILSNLHLDAIDEVMDGSSTRLVRFADDFVILTRTAPKAAAALERMSQLLADHGLALNPDKTRIVPFDQAFKFLGHIFLRSMVWRDDESGAPRIGARAMTPNGLPPEVMQPTSVSSPPVRKKSRKLNPPKAPDPNEPPTAPLPPSAFHLIPTPRDIVDDFEADRDEDDLATGLAPLYVLQPGRRLVVENEGFAVFGEGRRIMGIPANRLGRIDLGADVEADDRALRLAAVHRIPVHLLNAAGMPEAVVMPGVSADAPLHLAQARLALDPALALEHCRILVVGRIRNAHAQLKRLNRRRKLDPVEQACSRMGMARRRALHAASMDVARGFEGESAAQYWPALGACLEHGWTLKLRQRGNDKTDAVNAVLDWTASLLARDCRAAVLRSGLHPGFGVLHAARDGRDSCVFDLIEEFRAPLAEALTVTLFNNRVLDAKDFVLRDGEMRITGAGGPALIKAYEAWLARVIINPATKRRTTWRGLILLQARALAKAATTSTPYAPYGMDY